jgi:hypothetical protein
VKSVSERRRRSSGHLSSCGGRIGRRAAAWSLVLAAGLFTDATGLCQPSGPEKADPPVIQAIGIQGALAKLKELQTTGQGDGNAALLLRTQIMERLMLASFEVDETLARIDAEAAHVSDSRSVLEAQKQHREAVLNIATFAVSGALGTAGSAMELTHGLSHAGNALSLAGGASALSLSLVQVGMRGDRRLLRSPYNMLAEVLGQEPNSLSHYPAVVEAYLKSPTARDGQLPDDAPPEVSLREAWLRLHRLQSAQSHQGASLASATTDPTSGQKLTESELADREAMLRDLHGAVALVKTELRSVLATLDSGQ